MDSSRCGVIGGALGTCWGIGGGDAMISHGPCGAGASEGGKDADI